MKNPPHEVGTDAPILQMGKLRLRGWLRNTSFWELNLVLSEGEAPFLTFRKEETPPAKLSRWVLLCDLPEREALSARRAACRPREAGAGFNAEPSQTTEIQDLSLQTRRKC